jgi:hypothetical protein
MGQTLAPEDVQASWPDPLRATAYSWMEQSPRAEASPPRFGFAGGIERLAHGPVRRSPSPRGPAGLQSEGPGAYSSDPAVVVSPESASFGSGDVGPGSRGVR